MEQKPREARKGNAGLTELVGSSLALLLLALVAC